MKYLPIRAECHEVPQAQIMMRRQLRKRSLWSRTPVRMISLLAGLIRPRIQLRRALGCSQISFQHEVRETALLNLVEVELQGGHLGGLGGASLRSTISRRPVRSMMAISPSWRYTTWLVYSTMGVASEPRKNSVRPSSFLETPMTRGPTLAGANQLVGVVFL